MAISFWRTWLRPRFSLRLLFVAFILIAIGMAYLGSYVSRSLQGRYEPAVIGLGGVEWYDWAPRGFVRDYEWDPSLVRIYYPLWQIDRRFWHRPEDAEDGNYPLNEVKPEDIWKVYQAWK